MGLFSFLKSDKNSKWNALRVVNKEHISPNFVILSLEVPEKLYENYQFIPGQYITIEQSVSNKTIRRSYSICSASKNPLKIGVKKVEGGEMSTFLHDVLHIGSELKAHIPEGNFTINEAHQICVFAAGSGVTPIASMVESYHQTKKIKVFNAIRYQTDFLFKETLDKVSTKYFISQENIPGFAFGRLDYNAILEEIKNDVGILKSDLFVLCGPEGFMAEAERALLFFGVSNTKIKREYFIPPTPKKKQDTAVYSGKTMVHVVMSGEKHDIEMTAGKNTLLEVVEKAKLNPPYSCRGGVCSSCKAKITDGEAKMRQNFNLTDKEVADGYILTCQADPISEEITITFDV